MTRLIVDTDTAGDDVFSLLIALRHPNATLEAITVCCGNVAFEQEVENALYTVEMAGRAGEVPVYAGCPQPLIAGWVGAEYVHGQDGMGDSFFPRAAQRPEPGHAVDELVRRVNESPGELTILAQAPLTNLAAAVVRDPSIAQKVARLYVMGGGDGNITPAAEYNFFVDPEAARIVLNAGFPLTLFTNGQSTGDILYHLLVSTAYVAWSLTGVVAFSFMVSCMTDAPFGAIFAGVGLYFASLILDAISSLGSIRYVLPTHYFDTWVDLLTRGEFHANLWRGVLLQLVYITVFFLIALWWFKRKDIKS